MSKGKELLNGVLGFIFKKRYHFELDTLKRYKDKTLITMRDDKNDVSLTITFDTDLDIENMFKKKKMIFR